MGFAMLDLEQLDDQLLEALSRLYDPDYDPPAMLLRLTVCSPADGPTPLQTTLIQAIGALKPAQSEPADDHLHRVYEVLHSRFVLRRTQEATAQYMGLSVRQLNRVQREAVHTLLQQLWEHCQELSQSPVGAEESQREQDREEPLQANDWQSQTARELASLQASAPGSVSDVAELLQSVLALQATLDADQDLAVRIAHVQPDLVAAVHPAVLQQLLLTTLRRMRRLSIRAPLTLFAGLEDGRVRITLSAAVNGEAQHIKRTLGRRMLAPDDVITTVRITGNNVFFNIHVRSADRKVTVAVIDDNVDMVRFYRRATAGTRYQIVPFEDEMTLVDRVSAAQPDIIVTDLMLPHQDGWQILMKLQNDPATRTIPIIVCSVVRERELALSLGAQRYLSKPVAPRDFIQALDQVLRSRDE